MKNASRQVLKIEAELVAGKQLLRSKKARVKHARSKLERNNAKRAKETISSAIKSLEHHRDILEEQAADFAPRRGNR